MFEVDVKHVMKGRGEGKEEDQLGFGVLMSIYLVGCTAGMIQFGHLTLLSFIETLLHKITQ